MFHIRRSYVFIATIVLLLLIIILFQTSSLHGEAKSLLLQFPAEKYSENYAENFRPDSNKIKLSTIRKTYRYLRENDTKTFNRQFSRETNAPLWEARPQSLDTKLLEDNELRLGETSDSDQAAPDVVIKYDNGMFGLIDSEPTLHVWRTAFATIGQVWPHPHSVTTTKNLFTLCSRPGILSFKLTGVDNYIIQTAIARYKKLICDKKVSFYPSNWRQQEHVLTNAVAGQHIFVNTPYDKSDINYDSVKDAHARYKGEVRLVSLRVWTSGHQWPSLYMNESYQLSVTNHGIMITAQETWGLLRALETVAQLAWRTRSGRVFINETRVKDAPRFKHRGLMLDTARHFVAKEVILKNLDAMEMSKMNVFHWHISDDQSFPLVTDNHPEFAKHGAYDPITKVYRPDDVREILEYARLRGIRVVPEIDSPSHSLSWRKSHPEVMTRCIDINGRWSGHYGPLNMAGAATYRLLRSLFSDVVHLFPDQWIHLGSDEVPTSCLLNNQAIQKWMQASGIYSVDFLTDFYLRKLQNIITEIGHADRKLQRGFIVWQEAYERNGALKNGTIVQLWKSQSTSEAVALARQSVPVIYSSCWYLDRLEYGAQWISHYQCDPGEDFGSMLIVNEYNAQHSSGEQWRDYILGGEAAMWMEFFDSDSVLSRIWPLACASAERLWSPGSINNVESAAPRLEEMRCRLMIRSIPVGVAGGAGDCGQSDEGNLGLRQDPGSLHQLPIYGALIEVSETSSLTLVGQLWANMMDHSLPIIVLLPALALCIYLHRRSRLSSSRRALLVLVAVLSLYTLASLVHQHAYMLQ